MVMDVLFISEGSWFVPLMAEKATLALPERTDIPSEEVTPPSEEGLESHTTRHFPSRTMGSVSFWPRQSPVPHPRRKTRASMAKGPGQAAGTMIGTRILCKLILTTIPLEVWCDSITWSKLTSLSHFLSLTFSLSLTLSLSLSVTHRHTLLFFSSMRISWRCSEYLHNDSWMIKSKK